MKDVKSVLIIDDDNFFNEDIVDLLSFENISAEKVDSLQEALKKVDSDVQYTFFILDVMMSSGELDIGNYHETGEYLFSHIRKKKKYERTPIAIVSAKNRPDIDINFNDKHTRHFIKPINLRDIKEIVSFGYAKEG